MKTTYNKSEILLAEAIANHIEDRAGNFFVEVQADDNMMIMAEDDYTMDGYHEDDYFNGTGAWVITYIEINITDCKIYICDENSGISLNTDNVERLVKQIAA